MAYRSVVGDEQRRRGRAQSEDYDFWLHHTLHKISEDDSCRRSWCTYSIYSAINCFDIVFIPRRDPRISSAISESRLLGLNDYDFNMLVSRHSLPLANAEINVKKSTLHLL